MASVSTQNPTKISSSKNTQLSSNDRNAIFHYYMTLNKYYNTNKIENSPGSDRSKSSRAVKARKRLLNLHTYQFFELITDVHDEVERRTNSDQENEYLLPQDDLHLKRNQARQKLANLSMKRFLDLVDDLSFEIRRRQYDLDPQFDDPVEHADESEVVEEKDNVSPTVANNIGSSTTATDNEEPEKSISTKPSVQQVNVKKANMHWSDDEDEHVEPKHEEKKSSFTELELPNGFTKQNVSIANNYKNNETPSLKNPSLEDVSHDERDFALQAANASINKKNDEVEKALQLRIDDLTNTNTSLMTKNNTLIEENTKLKEKLDLEIQNKNHLSKELSNNEEIINHLRSEVESNNKNNDNEQYQTKNYMNIVSDNKQLSIENEDLKQKITDLEIANKLLNTTEGVKTDMFDGNISNFGEEYFSQGIIPIDYVNEFQSKVVEFSKKVQQYNPQQSNKSLFLSAINLSDTVTNIVKSVEMQDSEQLYTEYCILANTSSTHLITTLKYQSKFSAIFPKIIIQNALLEILGSLYQLVYKAGCNMNDGNVQSSPSVEAKRNLTNRSISDISKNSGKEAGSSLDKATNEYNDSPVRPLKITQRMSSLPQVDDLAGATSTNGGSMSATRKHSNTGLFSGMLLTSKEKEHDSEHVSNEFSKKNVKGLSLNLKKDAERLNTGKSTANKSQGIMNRVKAFEESSFNEGNSSKDFVENVSDVSLDSRSHKRTPSKSFQEIDILQKRNSLQSIEDRVSAFGEMKNAKVDKIKSDLRKSIESQPKGEISDHDEKGEERSYALSDGEKDLNDLLHYLENESIEVISTIQSLLTSIKNPKTTIKELNGESEKIMHVVSKVCENAMISVEKNDDLKTIGEYIITSLQDCERRMKSLIETDRGEYPDKAFKQRLAGIAFDIAKNVKKLVKVVEELSLKKEIAHLDQQLL
ncbi:hypothetical protein ACO0R3_002678 [Hanseniaspora guilliermondii]